MPMQYTDIFKVVKKVKNFSRKYFDIFLNFAKNIDCGYTVLMSTHNLFFGTKIRKIIGYHIVYGRGAPCRGFLLTYIL